MWRLAVILISLTAAAEIVDRIAASVGGTVITESQVMEDVRVGAFLDGAAVDLGADQKKKAVERLIDQELMRREIAFIRYSAPAEAEILPLYQQVRNRFPSEEAYQAELTKYGLTDSEVRQHLQWQLMMLRFIEYRFQPGVQVNEADIRREYDQFANQWRDNRKSEPPPLEQVRGEIEKLAQQRLIDSALDRWLGEVRTQNEIVYRKGYEQ